MNYKEKYYKHHGLDKCDVLECKNCGAVAVNLHHVIYGGLNGVNNEPSNLIPLCYNCHSGHHNNNKPTTEDLKKLG